MAEKILLEYSLTQPPDELLPFDPWFGREPSGRVYGMCVRFEGGVGRAVYVPMPQTPAFIADVLAMPVPHATMFRLDRLAGGLRVINAEWKEPIFPGVYSPMAVNDRALGPGAVCALTITRREVRHRVLAPTRDSTATLWHDIHLELGRYCGFSATNVKLDLVRIAPWDLPVEPAAASHALLKFQAGAFRAGQGDAAADDLATMSALGAHGMLQVA